MNHTRNILLADLALTMSEVFSAPARSGSPLLGGALGHMPLFDGADPTQQIMGELKNIETRLSTKLDTRLAEIKADKNVPDIDLKIKGLEAEHAQLKADLAGIQAQNGRPGMGGAGGEVKTAGQQFTEAEEFKHRGNGRFSVTVEMKALTGAAGSVGAVLEPQRLPIVEAPREPHIRDLLSSGTTSARSLQFPQRKEWVNNAAPVAEGGKKPESTFKMELVSTDVKKVAHYIKASTEILEDFDGLRSYIDAQLIDGLDEVEDRQIIKGDGTGQNLLGLYVVAQAFNRAKTGDTLLDKLLRAPTQLRLVNRNLSGYVLNPEDWEEVMLSKGSDNHYIWLNVLDGNGNPRLLARPVRDTTALSKGEWLAGDFRRGAQLFDRQQAQVTVANQNEDDFTNNLVTIMAERREALVIYDRLAFIKNPASA